MTEPETPRTGPTTGIVELDRLIGGIEAGDNIVWQVDDIEEYAYFVGFFVKRAVEDGRKVIYMRFAQHRPLVAGSGRVKV